MFSFNRLGFSAVVAIFAVALASPASASSSNWGNFIGQMSAEMHDQAAKAALAKALAASKITCTVTAKRYITEGKTNAGLVNIFELHCKEGAGYVLLANNNDPEKSIFYDCVIANKPGPDGKPTPLACKLPDNARP